MIRTLSPLSVGNNQEPVLHHAKEDQAVLTVVLAVVYEVDREWIIEGFAGLLEAHAVLGEIGSSLDLVPLEIIVRHVYGLSVSRPPTAVALIEVESKSISAL